MTTDRDTPAIKRWAKGGRLFLLAVGVSLLFHVFIFEWSASKKINGPAYYDRLVGRVFKVQRIEMEPLKPILTSKNVVHQNDASISSEGTVLAPPAFPSPKTERFNVPMPSLIFVPKSSEKGPIIVGEASTLPAVERDSVSETQRVKEVLVIQEKYLKENVAAQKIPSQ